MTQNEILTSGMVGKEVQILFDSSWSGLSKTLVFRCDGICRTVDGSLSPVTIPEDVLFRPFRKLYVGVYGTDEAGTLVIPTLMAEGPMICYGADPTEDSGAADLPVWKTLQEQIGDLSNLDTDTKENLVAAINELLIRTDFGLSNIAVELLINILRHAVYDTDQHAAIDALETALLLSGEESDKESDEETDETPQIPPQEQEAFPINLSVSYAGGDVPAGTALTALTGITVTARYSDGQTRPVTDYTLSGTIVEGNNYITVSYFGKTAGFTVVGTAESSSSTLLYSWDFTKTLTDSVSNMTIATANTTQDENGLHFTADNSIATTGIDISGKTIEVEFGDVSKQGTGHGRCITFHNTPNGTAPSYGIIWHNTGKWASYNMPTSGWLDIDNTNPNAIANSTVKISFPTDNNEPFDVLLNGEIMFSGLRRVVNYKYLFLGSGGTAFYNMTVKKLKIYEGA